MNPIPLVRMRYADSFAQKLQRIGAPVERLLNGINLSEEMLGERDDFITVSQLWRLTALAADYSGNFDFGFEAGLTPLEEHSQFGQNLLYAPTLQQAFEMFCQMAPMELTNAEFSIRRERERVWFCGGPVHGTPAEQLQVGLYRLAMFVQLVRWAAGPEWRPQRVRLPVASVSGMETDLIRGASLEFNCREPAIEVPVRLLARELLIEPPASARIAGSPQQLSLNFRNSLRQVLRTHIRGHRFRIDQTADALDLSVRTLQRRLAEHGLVYSELVEQTRIDLARRLLQDTDLPIADIAREVGYGESTHFSRAFRRITGNSPRDFRSANAA
jgi:AraC-like DNA-binding protein